MAVFITDPFKKFGYWWFQIGRMTYGPYHSFADAQDAITRKTAAQ